MQVEVDVTPPTVFPGQNLTVVVKTISGAKTFLTATKVDAELPLNSTIEVSFLPTTLAGVPVDAYFPIESDTAAWEAYPITPLSNLSFVITIADTASTQMNSTNDWTTTFPPFGLHVPVDNPELRVIQMTITAKETNKVVDDNCLLNAVGLIEASTQP